MSPTTKKERVRTKRIDQNKRTRYDRRKSISTQPTYAYVKRCTSDELLDWDFLFSPYLEEIVPITRLFLLPALYTRFQNTELDWRLCDFEGACLRDKTIITASLKDALAR